MTRNGLFLSAATPKKPGYSVGGKKSEIIQAKQLVNLPFHQSFLYFLALNHFCFPSQTLFITILIILFEFLVDSVIFGYALLKTFAEKIIFFERKLVFDHFFLQILW